MFKCLFLNAKISNSSVVFQGEVRLAAYKPVIMWNIRFERYGLVHCEGIWSENGIGKAGQCVLVSNPALNVNRSNNIRFSFIAPL